VGVVGVEYATKHLRAPFFIEEHAKFAITTNSLVNDSGQERDRPSYIRMEFRILPEKGCQ
jgi:hypothetical protein